MDRDTANYIDTKIKDVVQESQSGLLSSLDTLISSRLQTFQAEFKESQKEISNIQLTQIKNVSSDKYQFKRKAHAEQFEHNNQVLERFQEANFHLQSGASDSRDKVMENISEGLTDAIRHDIQKSGLMVTDRTEGLARDMAFYLIQSRADSTVSKYFSYFRRWSVFISDIGGKDLPASSVQIALYLTHLLNTKSSSNVIYATKYAIKWVHELFGYGDPTSNGFVNNLVESSKRIGSKAIVKKEPVSSENIIDLCTKYNSSTDLAVFRDLAMIVLGFAGFLRFNEISALLCKDVYFHDDYLSLKISKSKTDQYRLGNEVVIAKGHSVACPYKILTRYIELAQIDLVSDNFLFRPLFRSESTCKLIYKNKPLSYTRARECIVIRLREVVGDTDIGLHSLRAGGATAAANSGTNERCWKRHGRWRSEAAKDGYVRDSLESRLKVSQSLNL